MQIVLFQAIQISMSAQFVKNIFISWFGLLGFMAYQPL